MNLMTQFYSAQEHYYDLRREAAKNRLIGGNKHHRQTGWLADWLMLLKTL